MKRLGKYPSARTAACLTTWLCIAAGAATAHAQPLTEDPKGPAPISDPPRCPGGQSITVDTDGHCCWPAQVWSHARGRCVGVPQCAAGFVAKKERCQLISQCPPGQRVDADTSGHCCFPDQAWSQLNHRCVGVPTCEDGWVVAGETCVEGKVDQRTVSGWRASEGFPGQVPVTFVAKLNRNQYTLHAGSHKCNTPCRLFLPPGRAHIVTSGDGVVETDIVVGDGPGTMQLQHVANGELITGIVLMVSGTGMMLSNIALESCRGGCFEAVLAFGMVLGPIIHFVGIITMGVGLSRLSGANTLVTLGGPISTRTTRPRLRFAGAGLAPSAGGASGALSFVF